jgi:hypothetical protein
LNLPGFGIELPGTTATQTQKIGPFASMDARAFLTQQLLNISAWQAWHSSRSREDSYRLLVDNAREFVALAVIATYLDALRAKASRDTLVEQTKLASDLYRLTLDRVNQGASAQLDANRALQQVNTREQERLEAEQIYVAAKLGPANILRARITSDYEIADEACRMELLTHFRLLPDRTHGRESVSSQTARALPRTPGQTEANDRCIPPRNGRSREAL